MKKLLKTRFEKLWEKVSARGDPSNVLMDLEKQYTQSGRYYHTLGHLEDCFKEFDKVSKDLLRPNETEMAIWFHDAIYDTKIIDNEQRSARLAEEVLKKADLPYSFYQKVSQLVMATTHKTEPFMPDEKYLVDIDLSVFGRPEQSYDDFEIQIRQEYSWLFEKDFRDGRARLLNRFLSRESIYQTPFFRNLYESQAKYNINRAVYKLIGYVFE